MFIGGLRYVEQQQQQQQTVFQSNATTPIFIAFFIPTNGNDQSAFSIGSILSRGALAPMTALNMNE